MIVVNRILTTNPGIIIAVGDTSFCDAVDAALNPGAVQPPAGPAPIAAPTPAPVPTPVPAPTSAKNAVVMSIGRTDPGNTSENFSKIALFNLPFVGFTLTLNGQPMRFVFNRDDAYAIQSAAFAGISSGVSSADAQYAALQTAVLHAFTPADSSITLQSLGFTVVQNSVPFAFSSVDVPPITRMVPAFLVTAPAGTTVEPGKWDFNLTASGATTMWWRSMMVQA